jgi:hypothetical protein
MAVRSIRIPTPTPSHGRFKLMKHPTLISEGLFYQAQFLLFVLELVKPVIDASLSQQFLM